MTDHNHMHLMKLYNLIWDAKVTLNQLPPSREHSMVATKLDEAELWMGRLSTLPEVKSNQPPMDAPVEPSS